MESGAQKKPYTSYARDRVYSYRNIILNDTDAIRNLLKIISSVVVYFIARTKKAHIFALTVSFGTSVNKSKRIIVLLALPGD